MIQKNT